MVIIILDGNGGQGGASRRAGAREERPPPISTHSASIATGKRRWIPPSSLTDHNASLSEERKNVIFRKVRGILNKLTPEKFDKLSLELLNVGIDSQVVLKGIILLIFEKALDEPKYSSLYAQLCSRLCEDAPNFDPPSTNTTTFKRLLLNKCRDEFENRSRAFEAFDTDRRLSSEEQEQCIIAKRKMLGNIKFMGELGKLQMLHEGILHRCIQALLEKKKKVNLKDLAEDIECLCQIMKTVGKRLDTDKAKLWMDTYFDRMQSLMTHRELLSRVRFMIQDVVELRENNWKPRKNMQLNDPRTISQVREEAAKEYGINVAPGSIPSSPPFTMDLFGRPLNGNHSHRNAGMQDFFNPMTSSFFGTGGIGTGPGVITMDNFGGVGAQRNFLQGPIPETAGRGRQRNPPFNNENFPTNNKGLGNQYRNNQQQQNNNRDNSPDTDPEGRRNSPRFQNNRNNYRANYDRDKENSSFQQRQGKGYQDHEQNGSDRDRDVKQDAEGTDRNSQDRDFNRGQQRDNTFANFNNSRDYDRGGRGRNFNNQDRDRGQAFERGRDFDRDRDREHDRGHDSRGEFTDRDGRYQRTQSSRPYFQKAGGGAQQQQQRGGETGTGAARELPPRFQRMQQKQQHSDDCGEDTNTPPMSASTPPAQKQQPPPPPPASSSPPQAPFPGPQHQPPRGALPFPPSHFPQQQQPPQQFFPPRYPHQSQAGPSPNMGFRPPAPSRPAQSGSPRQIETNPIAPHRNSPSSGNSPSGSPTPGHVPSAVSHGFMHTTHTTKSLGSALREEISLRPNRNFTPMLRPNIPSMLPKSAQSPHAAPIMQVQGPPRLSDMMPPDSGALPNPNAAPKQPTNLTIKHVDVAPDRDRDRREREPDTRSLTKDELNEGMAGVMKVLVDTGDVGQAMAAVKDMKLPWRYIAQLVSFLVLEALDKTDTDRDKVSQLIAALKNKGIVSSDLFMEGFGLILDQMRDREKEVPLVKSNIARLAAQAVASDIITLTDLAEPMDLGAHYPLFLLCLQQLAKVKDKDWLTSTFQDSKIELQNMLPECDRNKDRVMEILEDRGLSFLFPLLRVQSDLWRVIRSDPSPNSVYKWIKENVSGNLQTDPAFINILVSNVLRYVTSESALKEGASAALEKKMYNKEKELLDKYKGVLQMFLHDSLELQVTAIYSLQLHCHNNDFPKGMMLRMFMNLYELEIVDEESFIKWKEEVNDQVAGKGKALFQVNTWLTWLEHAEEEDSDED